MYDELNSNEKNDRKPLQWVFKRTSPGCENSTDVVNDYSYDNRSAFVTELLDEENSQKIEKALQSLSLIDLYELARYITEESKRLAEHYQQLQLEHAVRRYLQKKSKLLKIVKQIFSERLQVNSCYKKIKADAKAYSKMQQRSFLQTIIEFIKTFFGCPLERNFQIYKQHLKYQNSLILNGISSASRTIECLAKEHLISGELLPENIVEFSGDREIESVNIDQRKVGYQIKVKFTDAEIIELYDVDDSIIQKCAFLRYQKIHQVLSKLKKEFESLENNESDNEVLARIANRSLDLSGRQRIVELLGVSPLNLASCVIKPEGDHYILEIRRLDSAITGVGTESYPLTTAQVEDFIYEQYQKNKIIEQQFKP